MATTITPVQADHIQSVLLIDLTIDSTTYYLSNGYRSFRYNSQDYQELGSFLSVDTIADDLRTTNGDIQIQLAGIPSDQNYLNLVLTTPIKGGNVTIYRGFMDADNKDLDTGQVYTRFKGIITNFNISESFDPIGKDLTNTVTVSVANLNTLLEQKISGQRTNPEDRKRIHPTDVIFDRIPELHNMHFDFGKEFNTSSGAGGSGVGGGGGGGGGGGSNRRNVTDRR